MTEQEEQALIDEVANMRVIDGDGEYIDEYWDSVRDSLSEKAPWL